MLQPDFKQARRFLWAVIPAPSGRDRGHSTQGREESNKVMMITFHASKHNTTGAGKDAHTPCWARWREELAEAADTSPGLHRENSVCAQISTFLRMLRYQWRIFTVQSPFPSTENGGTSWGSWCWEGLGEEGMQKARSKLPAHANHAGSPPGAAPRGAPPTPAARCCFATLSQHHVQVAEDTGGHR